MNCCWLGVLSCFIRCTDATIFALFYYLCISSRGTTIRQDEEWWKFTVNFFSELAILSATRLSNQTRLIVWNSWINRQSFTSMITNTKNHEVMPPSLQLFCEKNVASFIFYQHTLCQLSSPIARSLNRINASIAPGFLRIMTIINTAKYRLRKRTARSCSTNGSITVCNAYG